MTSDVRSPTPPPPPASSGNIQTQTSAVSAPVRPRTLMETLLVAKMEKAGACLTSSSPPSPLPALLLRTDSTDSASSLSSTSSDVCRCDDCLLGIADLYISSPEEEDRSRRKVGQVSANSSKPINTSKGQWLLYIQLGLKCKKTDNVRINVALRRFRLTIFAEEKQ